VDEWIVDIVNWPNINESYQLMFLVFISFPVILTFKGLMLDSSAFESLFDRYSSLLTFS